MPLRFLLLPLLLGFAVAAQAVDVSILDFQRKPNALKKVSKEEAEFFTGRVRKVAAQTDRSWRVMSRENIQKILEENGKSYADCMDSTEGKCEVAIGQILQADYHVVGDLSLVGGRIVLSIRVYDVRASLLRGADDASAPTVAALMDKVDGLARSLFRQLELRPVAEGGGSGGSSSGGANPGSEPGGAVPKGAANGRQEESRKRLVARFLSRPVGASIAVDGKEACKAPCSQAVVEGTHAVTATLAGFDALRRTIVLNQNGQVVELRMPRVQVRLKLDAVDDAGGDALVGDVLAHGVRIGQTPFDGHVPRDAMDLEVRVPGYVPALVTGVVENGGVSKVLALRRADAKARIELPLLVDPEADSGSIKDPRDGAEYGWVRIGTRAWLTRNLDFAAPSSRCADSGRGSDCGIRGRSYAKSSIFPSGGEVCPKGWRLPTLSEWENLLKVARERGSLAGVLNAAERGGEGERARFWGTRPQRFFTRPEIVEFHRDRDSVSMSMPDERPGEPEASVRCVENEGKRAFIWFAGSGSRSRPEQVGMLLAP